MPRGLKHIYGRGHLHFLTFSCYKRLPLLGTVRARNLFVKVLGEIRERYGFLLVGYVVMPEHVHLLVGEPKEGTPSTVLQMLKQRVSRKMRKNKRRVSKGQLRLLFSQGGDELARFWQPRFYDFNVYSAKKKREKLEYMHGNPVKRGLVKNPGAWMWSSFLYYEKGEAGLVSIDAVE
jgi:putative transposase